MTDTALVEHTVVAVVVDGLAGATSTAVRARSPVGRAVVVVGAVSCPALARESGRLVVALGASPLTVVDLSESAAAGALSAGRGGRVVGAAGQALAVVSVVTPGVLQVGSSRAVAVSRAWSGDTGSGAVGTVLAVVSDLAAQAGHALAALVLTGSQMTVVGPVASTSVPLVVVAAVVVVLASVDVVAAHVGEPAWVTVDLSAASATVVPASTVAVLASAVGVAPAAIASAAVVVEAESNPVSTVPEVTGGRVVVGVCAVAGSTDIP